VRPLWRPAFLAHVAAVMLTALIGVCLRLRVCRVRRRLHACCLANRSSAAMSSAARRLSASMHFVSSILSAALHEFCCVLSAARRLLHVVCCMLSVAWLSDAR
jgi:hypothetical protein